MWLLGYWVLPVISGCMWLAMLITMLAVWASEGYPVYPSEDDGQTIAYISDIGAFGLKPLFITGAVVTTVFLDLSFASERWLRHTGRLIRNNYTSQKILSAMGIVCAIAGSVGLILLTIFDTYHHPHLHDGLLLLFIAGYVLSAIFICAEYQRLGIHFRDHRILRISFWVKLTFILVEVVLAIVFASTNFANSSVQNVAAIFEWIIAFTFALYIFSFTLDLLPAVRTKHHIPQGLQDAEKRDVPRGEYVEPLTDDSTGGSTRAPPAKRGWGVGRFRF